MALTKIDDRGLKTPIDLIDNEKIRLGTGNDLELYHDGSNSRIANTTGQLSIAGGVVAITNAAVSENLAKFTADGAVELYHNNEKKLETTANGVTVLDDGDEARLIIKGGEANSASCYWYADEGDDNADKWRIMADTGGDLLIQNYGGGAWDENIKCVANGGVHLYHDDTWKLKVESNGTHLNDSLFINDNDTISIGTGGDLTIYHNGTNSIIHDTTSSNLNVKTSRFTVVNAADDETMLKCQQDGAVELYYDNSKVLETNNQGVTIQGIEGEHGVIYLNADEGDDNADQWAIVSKSDAARLNIQNFASGSWENSIECNGNGSVELYYDGTRACYTASNALKFDDNKKAIFGGNLEIKHDGTTNWIEAVNNHGTVLKAGTGILYLQGSQVHIGDAGGNEVHIKTVDDAQVELYYDNNKKLETDTDGVQITGYLQAHHNSSDSDYTAHDWHVLQSQEANKAAVIIEHSNNAQPFGLLLDFSDSAPNDHTYYFINATDNVETKFKVWSDGDVVNDDNSYGSTSDVKLKENIVDAGSQWDDVKAVKVRNFNFKKNKSKKLLGVVAQEIETISPGLVDNNTDMDKYNNDLGTTTKSVKYSILYMKAFKALQEAMVKIETLETKVAALEAK